MPLDALCLSAVTRELSSLLPGSRVDKVQQPERDVVVLQLRGAAGAVRLLLSAGTGTARVHLTREDRENPAEPPMFCMLLRKHLTGARLLSLEQPAWERMMLLTFACLEYKTIRATISRIRRTSRMTPRMLPLFFSFIAVTPISVRRSLSVPVGKDYTTVCKPPPAPRPFLLCPAQNHDIIMSETATPGLPENGGKHVSVSTGD